MPLLFPAAAQNGRCSESTTHASQLSVYCHGQPLMNLSSLLLRSTIVAALGGLLFGFDTAVIAGITSALTKAYGLTPSGLGLTVSSALWGPILGALLASIPGEKFGRRDSLRV